MAKLPRYELLYNKKSEDWDLRNQQHRIIKTFETKADATAGGTLSKAIGQAGGSVRIKTQEGKVQEERTFPRSRDPKRTPG